MIIDFIRHGDAVGEMDRERILSDLGKRQARAFGEARGASGEKYGLVITSGLLRAVQTAQVIAVAMGGNWLRLDLPELFDPETMNEAARARQDAYQKLGADTLFQYVCYCPRAMKAFGVAGAGALERILQEHSHRGNVLVIGHQVYVNEIISKLSFFPTGAPDVDQVRRAQLLHDPPLGGCEGYRLRLGKRRTLQELLRLTSPEAGK
jgi:broad specificity phosphatase PhoE